MMSTTEMRPTSEDQRDAATVCRERGWKVGTRLAGDEGYGVTVIEITAVGARQILARSLEHAGKRCSHGESEWVLWCRDWRDVTDEPLTVWCDDEFRTKAGAYRCDLPAGHGVRHSCRMGWWPLARPSSPTEHP